MEKDISNWLNLADKFAAEGNPQGMRACAQEIWDAEPGSAEGAAIMAQAALCSGNVDTAASIVAELLQHEPGHLRGRLVQAGIAAREFRLDEELPLLRQLIPELTAASQGQATQPGGMFLLRQAYGWLADALYLAADPQGAGQAMLALSKLSAEPYERAVFYSKYLFLSTYRASVAPADQRAAARHYEELLQVAPYRQARCYKPEKKLRLGYISPDFREHAVANFVAPLVQDFDGDRFTVFCYSLSRPDRVTQRLRHGQATWRSLAGRSPHTAARLIAEDELDILVDLSGHSDHNALPVMAYRPAPLQISGIGYTATTGLSTIDYFLSDETCLPSGDELAASCFTEHILRLPHSHLCYAPGAVHRLPLAGTEPPWLRNGYITFGSLNNFAKVTDDTLLMWREILDRVPNSHLVLKGKICSIPSGCQIVRERLQRLSFDTARVELRPYSPDYLEQYRDIDIALDTMPYNGGLTTCEALYMGVPVVTLRGRSHGSRFGASILHNAGVDELVVESDINYVRRAVQLGSTPNLVAAYHSGLRTNLERSALMNRRQYMAELESAYRQAWRQFCRQNDVDAE